MERSSKASYDIENICTPLLPSTSQTQENDLPPSSSSDRDRCCIYRVPEPLRCVNEKAYTPQVVSIGPLHHGKKGLEEMEGHKERCLQYFLEWTGVSKENYETEIKGKEAELRSCYAHTIKLCSDKFVNMILVDAAFIIELLLRFVKHSVQDSNDPIFNKPWSKNYVVPENDRIFSKPWLINYVIPDMLLLENQLPFFILEDLLATAEVTMPSVFDLSYKFCTASTSKYVNRDDSGSSSSSEGIVKFCTASDDSGSSSSSYKFCTASTSKNVDKAEHFVDLIRTSNLPPKKEREKVETTTVPSMTKLHQAGVKFEATSSKNLFDICFKDGILKIPHPEIDDGTELVLRNLIAFEQCHCSYPHYFIDYISLMDYLVDTPDDVELLLKNEHLLGDHKEVSTLINSLCKGVVVSGNENFYYATLSENLNKYYNKDWNKWKADLKQKYFKSPWTTISVIGATLIIILGIIQTVCSFSQCAQR